jgi:hypothetical protein
MHAVARFARAQLVPMKRTAASGWLGKPRLRGHAWKLLQSMVRQLTGTTWTIVRGFIVGAANYGHFGKCPKEGDPRRPSRRGKHLVRRHLGLVTPQTGRLWLIQYQSINRLKSPR